MDSLIIACCLLGPMALLAGVVGLWRRARLLKQAARATGQIVAHKPVEEDDDAILPLVQFKTSDGLIYEFLPRRPRAPETRPLGLHVEVLYDPEEPEQAQLTSFADLWLAPVSLSLLGAGVCVAPLSAFLG